MASSTVILADAEASPCELAAWHSYSPASSLLRGDTCGARKDLQLLWGASLFPVASMRPFFLRMNRGLRAEILPEIARAPGCGTDSCPACAAGGSTLRTQHGQLLVMLRGLRTANRCTYQFEEDADRVVSTI